MSFLLFMLAAYAAEILGTLAGFGAATTLTPAASFFMDMKAAIALVALFHMFGNANRVWLFRGQVDWKLFWQFGAPGVLCSLLGASLASSLPSITLKWIFGLFLVVFVLASALLPDFGLKASRSTALAGGVSSGFVAGLIGTGGAFRSACLLAFGQTKERYIATSAMIALVVDSTRLPIYVANGAFRGENYLFLVPGLFMAAFCGSRTGKALVRRIPPALFKKIVLGALFLMGVKLLWDGLNG